MKDSTRRFLTALAMIAGLIASHRALAIADGDGTCSVQEKANYECTDFGTNNVTVVEFLGSFQSNNCTTVTGLATCTSYFYKYKGLLTNQVNVAIPIRNTKTLTTATDLHCAQYVTGGAGDPTTGFGKNQFTLGVCRTAQNVAGPPDVTRPVGANIVISVDPSAYDKNTPLDWQLRQPSLCRDRDDVRVAGVSGGTVLGPFGAQADVLESAVTLTTPGGQTVGYSNIGGNVQITGGTSQTARIIPDGGFKICTVNPTGNAAIALISNPAGFAANWTCETVTFVSDQCDIKTKGADPCRSIGGKMLCY